MNSFVQLKCIQPAICQGKKKQDLEDWLSESAAAVLRPFLSLCETNTDFVKHAPSHKINLFVLLVEIHWVYLIDNQSEEDLLFSFCLLMLLLGLFHFVHRVLEGLGMAYFTFR